MALEYKLNPGLGCLLNRDPTARAKICHHTQTTGNENSCNTENCQPIDPLRLKGTLNSSQLYGDTPYVFTGVITYDNSIYCTHPSVTERTLEGTPSSAPRNVSMERNHSTLILSWLPPLAADCNGNITHYNVSFAGGSQLRNGMTYSEAYDPSKDYSFKIRACTTRGCGPSASAMYPSVSTSPPKLGGSTDARLPQGN